MDQALGPSTVNEAAPLFILSGTSRDALSGVAARGGWLPVVADAGEGDAARFTASGAAVAVIDARDAVDATLPAIGALAKAAGDHAGAVLVILSQADKPRLEAVFTAGATHYLVEPFDEAEMLVALRFAGRRAARGEAVQSGSAPTRHDSLTGLPDALATRRWVAEQLSGPDPVGLLLVGLDRLQLINSVYGWAGGDVLLQAAIRRIEAAVQQDRPDAWMGRLSGTEFLIGLPGAREQDLQQAADAILQAVARRFVAAPDMFLLSANIGGLLAAGEDAADALKRLGAALADAREAGSGAICLLGPHSAETMPRSHRLAEELWHAIEARQIETLFQPIVCVADGRVEGVEALSRWQHPELGEIGAEALFAAAERAHLMVELTRHVQQQALEAAATWTGPLQCLRLSLNVGASEIVRPDFAREMLARIDESGLGRDRVTLEVTEEGLIEDLGPAAEMLATLRAGGCRVAVDDFGTGYSSLAYLKALPLDYLKLDKRLSQDITGSPRDRVVVRSVIDMARSLGLGVVAEGVETAEQLALLAAEGCTLYQGYLCSTPVPAAELSRIVTQAASLASPRDS